MDALAREIHDKLDSRFSSDHTWIAFMHELNTTKNLETALGNVTLSERIHSSIILTIWQYIDNADRCAIAGFLREGSYPALTHIIRKFVQQTGQTNIITTNYDRLIEFSIDIAEGVVETGFSGCCIKSFGFYPTTRLKRTVNLYKVHGSIDWYKHKNNHNILATTFFDNDVLSDIYEPMIVTPGINKYRETHNDPFRTVMTEADKALRNSSSYLCIGYGFNDEHIQPVIIDENRNRKKPIVVVTKEVTQRMRYLFLENGDCNCVIISENPDGGTCVHYSRDECEVFPESFWHVNEFYKLWME